MATTRDSEIKLLMSNIKQVKIARRPTATVSMTRTGRKRRKMKLMTAIIQIIKQT